MTLFSTQISKVYLTYISTLELSYLDTNLILSEIKCECKRFAKCFPIACINYKQFSGI